MRHDRERRETPPGWRRGFRDADDDMLAVGAAAALGLAERLDQVNTARHRPIGGARRVEST